MSLQFANRRLRFGSIVTAVAVSLLLGGLPANPAQAGTFAPGTLIPVGQSPVGVLVSPNSTRLYVANAGDDTVTVINTADNSVITSVGVGDNPQALAIAPDGRRLYVTNVGDGTVSVVDTSSNTVVGSPIRVGGLPYGIAISPDGTRLFVSNFADGTVSEISTTTNTVSQTIDIGTGSGPYGLGVSPNGGRLYVAGMSSSKVYTLNLFSAPPSMLNVSNLTFSPKAIAVAPNFPFEFYVTRFDALRLVKFDYAGYSGPEIEVGSNPAAVAVAPNGLSVYVALSTASGQAVTVNPTAMSVASTTAVGRGPGGVAVSPNNMKIYVTNSTDGTVSVLEPTIPPENNLPPELTGTAVNGETLTTTAGTWSGYPTPTLSYQWQSCTTVDCVGGTITSIGTNQLTYQLTAAEVGKYVRAQVSATNGIDPAVVASSNISSVVGDVWNGFTYTATGGAATITRYNPAASGATAANVVIPATLGGAPTTAVGLGAFDNAGITGSLSVPDSVTTIGDVAFRLNPGLTAVSFGTSQVSSQLRSIGTKAFEQTGLVGRLQLPNALTSIGGGAFIGMLGLTSIAFGTSQQAAQLQTIGIESFDGNSGLTGTLNLPDSLTSVATGAFSDIGPVTLSLASSRTSSHLTTIGNGAFSFEAANTSLEIPDSVVSIGSSAFSEFGFLTSLTIGSSVASIGSSAFDLAPLTSIVFTGNAPVIGEAAFYNATYNDTTPLTRWQGATGWGETLDTTPPAVGVLPMTVVIAAPTVTSLTPSSGAGSGGEAVTITGTGFAPGATVTFGGLPAATTVVSSRAITAVAPAGGSIGAVNVAVTNVAVIPPTGTGSPLRGSLAAAYRYPAPPSNNPGATPTTQPAQVKPTSPPLAPNSAPPVPTELKPGAGSLLINGVSTPVVIAASPDGKQLIITGGGIRLVLNATAPDGKPLPLAPDGSLVISQGGGVPVAGTGFLPGSTITLYLYSSPVLVGTSAALPAGAFSGRAAIPVRTSTGTHTIQLRGTSVGGTPISLSLGVSVKTPAAARGANPSVRVSGTRVHLAGAPFMVEARGVQAHCPVRFSIKASTSDAKTSAAGIARATLLAPGPGVWTVLAVTRGKGCDPAKAATRIRITSG